MLFCPEHGPHITQSAAASFSWQQHSCNMPWRGGSEHVLLAAFYTVFLFFSASMRCATACDACSIGVMLRSDSLHRTFIARETASVLFRTHQSKESMPTLPCLIILL